MYNCSGASREDRYSCKLCGGRVFSRLRNLGCTAVYRDSFQPWADDRFKPSCHIFYPSGCVNKYDDLPKFEGFPPAFGGSDGRLVRSDLHAASWVPWKEARGTFYLGVAMLIGMFTTPAWSSVLLPLVGAGEEWHQMPWRVFMNPLEQWVRMPTFLVCEYLMYALAALAFWHARRNASMDLFFAAWTCGTANDIFFMYLPFADNFWQGQTTFMLTPRLPLYILAMYVGLMYYANTAAMRMGFASPLAEAAAAGLLAACWYGVYDLCGPLLVDLA